MNQQSNRIILDYETKPSAARRWLRRMMWVSIVITAMLLIPIAWLYIDWHREHVAIERIGADGGSILRFKMLEIPVVSPYWPKQFDWLLQRADDIYIIDNKAIPHLDRFRYFKCLSLGPQMTDSCLSGLRQLKNLKTLYIVGTKVTAKGRADLEKSLPNCYVVWKLHFDSVNESELIESDEPH